MEVAIIAALGQILGAVGGIVSSANERQAAYQDWLSASVPQYVDPFAAYRSKGSTSNLIIIGVLAVLIVVVLVMLSFKNKKMK